MKVSTLIVDDEQIARVGVREMLQAYDWIDVVGEASSGTAALRAIDNLRPELVFLDINMPGLQGLDVLRRATHQPFVVFTTAYAEHAATAFELGAVDYLLKPFGAERLRTTLDRVRAAIGEPAATPAVDRLRDALAKGPIRRLFVRSGPSIQALAVKDVSWFEATGDYVVAHVGAKRYTMHLALNRLESRLDPDQFARVHRAYIVNLDQVKSLKQVEKGRVAMELADGTLVPVSRSRVQDFRKLSF